MKKNYLIEGDFFVTCAFAAFIIGAVLYLLRIKIVFWDITTAGLIKFSYWCLLFSIALNIAENRKES